MKHIKPVTLCAVLAGSALVPTSAQESDVELLRQRAARDVPVRLPAEAPFTTPRVVLTRTGEDNATALLAHPDANGDGVPEIGVGWNIDQSGNDIELLDGGSFGESDLVWGLVSQDGISGGYYSDVDQLETFPDITGDGVAEILSGTSGGGRAATLYDGATGAVLQSFNTYLAPEDGWVYDVMPIEDVNGSGTPDFVLVTGSDADSVYVVEGSLTGVHHTEIWAFQASDAIFAVDNIGDANGDGIDDIVVAVGDNGDRIRAFSGATGEALWIAIVAGTPWEIATLDDQNGDGVREVVAAVWSSSETVELFSGKTGDTLWTSGVPNTFGMDVIPIEDVNGDGRPEIVVASWADSVFALSGQNGSLVWQTPVSGGDCWAITRVDDVTGDGISEIAYGSFDGNAYLADGSDGTTLWTHFADGRKVLSIKTSPDVDGDGEPEVIVGAQQLSSGFATLLWLVDADSTLATSGPELRHTGGTTIGTSGTLQVRSATAGHKLFWFVGLAPTLDANVGFGWLAVDPAIYLKALNSTVPGSGEVDQNLPIPNDVTLVGVDVYFQAFVLDPNNGFLGTTTNRIGFGIGS